MINKYYNWIERTWPKAESSFYFGMGLLFVILVMVIVHTTVLSLMFLARFFGWF